MERIYNTYLKIIKNICTGSDHSVSVHPEDLPALAKLAQEHCTVPFVLPYLRSASVYPAMKQQVKGIISTLIIIRLSISPGLPSLF